MKKILVLLLTLVLILTGCSKNNSSTTGLAWDCTEYSTLEELNNAAGSNIVKLSTAEVSKEWFGYISNSIAEYKFNVGDEEWSIRASKDVDNDISGLHYDSIKFEKDKDATYYTDDYDVHRIFIDGMQYVVSLNVKDKDISMSYFDEVSNQLLSSIAGVDLGYETTVEEKGDDVVYTSTIHDVDGSTLIMEIIYTFKDDKMVSIKNNNIFDSEEAAKAYYEELIKSGISSDKLVLDGNVISTEDDSNIDFYSDYTKADFINLMKSSLEQ